MCPASVGLRTPRSGLDPLRRIIREGVPRAATTDISKQFRPVAPRDAAVLGIQHRSRRNGLVERPEVLPGLILRGRSSVIGEDFAATVTCSTTAGLALCDGLRGNGENRKNETGRHDGSAVSATMISVQHLCLHLIGGSSADTYSALAGARRFIDEGEIFCIALRYGMTGRLTIWVKKSAPQLRRGFSELSGTYRSARSAPASGKAHESRDRFCSSSAGAWECSRSSAARLSTPR